MAYFAFEVIDLYLPQKLWEESTVGPLALILGADRWSIFSRPRGWALLSALSIWAVSISEEGGRGGGGGGGGGGEEGLNQSGQFTPHFTLDRSSLVRRVPAMSFNQTVRPYLVIQITHTLINKYTKTQIQKHKYKCTNKNELYQTVHCSAGILLGGPPNLSVFIPGETQVIRIKSSQLKLESRKKADVAQNTK